MKIVAANCISNFYPQNKEYVPGVCLLLLSFALLAVVAQPLHCRDGVKMLFVQRILLQLAVSTDTRSLRSFPLLCCLVQPFLSLQLVSSLPFCLLRLKARSVGCWAPSRAGGGLQESHRARHRDI